MKHITIAALGLACGLCGAQAGAAPGTLAQRPYTGADFSGIYRCKGMDKHDGPTGGSMTLKLVPGQSHGAYGAYDFTLDAGHDVIYTGQAASFGRHMARNFVHPDATKKDYGTGLSVFTRGSGGKWHVVNYYYEPEYKGGGMGTETCDQL